MQLIGKIVIKGKIKTLTGLHIGGAQGNKEIGGVDKSVVKDAEGKPYIPGSSLKGKMRSLLEREKGKLDKSKLYRLKDDGDETKKIRIHMCNEEGCPICVIFGRNNVKGKKMDDGNPINITNTTPTRLIVRDAYLIEESLAKVRDKLDLEWTEVKFENSLDRITSAANPRQLERVPRGAEFELEMVYSVLTEGDKERFKDVLAAMQLLEDDYLGGSGSRGYGKIAFEDLKLLWRPAAYYRGEKEEKELASGNLEALQKNFKPEELSC
ncbi:MAG: CRISPR-associated protein Csm3 [Eubacteriales bacterium]|nr:CRISPR-associated protein Csm3 [Eubacteriales bacterium]MDN5364325.1 CRISPR-associated protein Csm3 [Eubacteriales bacterium]